MRPTSQRLLLSAGVVLLTACGQEATAPPAPVAAVTVAPTRADAPVAQTVQLTATIMDAAGDVLKQLRLSDSAFKDRLTRRC